MPAVTCVEDLRRLARKRVPKAFYDYAEGGSYAEATLRANTDDYALLKLRQRVGIDVDNRSLRTALAGQDAAMPAALAPIGLTGMQWADGEILAARAAEAFGIPYTLSTMSICSIEDVAAATTQPFWFQLYVMRDRDFVAALIRRAKAARCSALMLTLDLQIQGQRHRDIRNGLTIPLRPTLANTLDMMTKPGWALRMLGGRRKTFGNLQGFVKDVDGVSGLGQWTARQFDPTLSWKDVDWIKQQWGGKLIVKGVLDAEDARRAVDAGADAIVVSNHGGRQLDGALSTIAALPAIARAVGGRTEVLVDGGIRSGQDVLKALALGARGVLLGRAYIYGLGALGQAGVSAALELIRQELDVSMALTGTRTVREVGPQVLA